MSEKTPETALFEAMAAIGEFERSVRATGMNSDQMRKLIASIHQEMAWWAMECTRDCSRRASGHPAYQGGEDG